MCYVAAPLSSEGPEFSIGTIGLGWIVSKSDGEMGDWFDQTWSFTKQIVPLLLGGVLVAGILLGRPGHEGLIPSEWISASVGGNGLLANFIASFAGAFMYFATLTELPILEGEGQKLLRGNVARMWWRHDRLDETGAP